MKKPVLIFMMLALATLAPASQGGPLPMAPGQTVVGKVTAVAQNSITVVPLPRGDPVTVKVGDNTRIFKERQPVKFTEIKVDDTVFTRGQLNGNTMDAAIIGIVNPEMIQRMKQGGGMGVVLGGQQFKPEDWGKTFIAGQIKSIHETTLTIARPDGQQTLNIEVDENTSFKKGRESITLADIKPDDFVFGPGEVRNGVFVAKELRLGGGRAFMSPRGTDIDQKKPEGDKPTSNNPSKPESDKAPTSPKN
jgi:hypothetical protein